MSKCICLILALHLLLSPSLAQDDTGESCTAEALTLQQNVLAQILTLDFENDFALALANLFRLGSQYQTLALQCGYSPHQAEANAMLAQTMQFIALEDVIAAQSVGDDVEAILIELEDTVGDPLTGQLLYNGLEPALGGMTLGCSGCHESEAIAPLTAGAWTRINDIRLKLPEFADYTVRQYLVESIVQPMAYVTPEHQDLMPNIYGGQLTTQQLADLVAYLDSQDQLLDEE